MQENVLKEASFGFDEKAGAIAFFRPDEYPPIRIADTPH